MHIEVRVRGLPHPDQARERARRSLAYALGRFSTRIARVSATVEDTNGPRGGPDKRCRLRASLTAGGDPLVVEILDADVNAAIDLAAGRLGRRVRRALERRASRRPAPLGPRGGRHEL